MIIIFLTSAGIVYATQYYSAPKQEDVSKAEQLTKITQLDVDTILLLYNAVGDWDKVIKNIAVYQQILTLVEGTPGEDQFFNLIQKYEADDLFVAYDYFTANRLPFDRITEVLDQRLQGGDWDTILTDFGTDREYKNYRALDKNELRELLDKGYLPDDILKADNIGRSNDLTLHYVLGLKTADNTWDNIADSLGPNKEVQRKISLRVPGVGQEIDDLSSLSSVSKQRTEEIYKESKIKVKTELGLTDGEMDIHLSQGFNPWEVRNAYKLALANGISPQEILDKKKAGRSWEEILAAYPLK